MKIYNTDIAKIEKPVVAAIGFFDGVHKGHRFLIEQIVEEAKKRSLASAVITFVEHPRKILQENFQPALLCGYDEKIKKLSETDIDCCIPLHFTEELSQLTAQDFMKIVLKERLNVDTLIIGYDHRFGYGRTDGFNQYVEYGKEIGMTVIQAKELETEYISSSHIRGLLLSGQVADAVKLLGYNYTISGKIIEGYKVGRTIGYPTANIAVWERYKVIPINGIYAVYVHFEGKKHRGMLYIGTRPTVHSDDEVSIEVNIFDINEDLYGKELTVEFLNFMRRDLKFNSIEILRRQLALDEERVRSFLKTIENN